MPGPEDPAVFVVDDDPSVGDSIRSLLRSVGVAAETFESATGFLDAFHPDRAGCLVLDVRMPGMSGLELQAELEERGSLLPIVFVTAHGDVPMAVRAMKAGADDFLQKPFRDQELLDRVQAALEENAGLRREAAGRAGVRARIESLTPREREVMKLVVAGRSNKKIAKALGIGRRTVEVHRAHVMEKMGVSSVPRLVRMAVDSRSRPRLRNRPHASP